MHNISYVYIYVIHTVLFSLTAFPELILLLHIHFKSLFLSPLKRIVFAFFFSLALFLV